MAKHKLAGIVTPVLTPFNDDNTVALDLYGAHSNWVLGQGSHYISPFGTTGEALSLGMDERMQVLESLVSQALISPSKIMPGTGLCSLPETVELTRNAVGLGCAAVMTLPPFFYIQASDEGLYRYFCQLIEQVASAELRICLYHIPPQAGIGFSPHLASRLNQEYPDTVIAIKDSGGVWENTQALLSTAPGLCVFPGSETFLLQGLEHGSAGCISATCNINAARIRQLYEHYHSADYSGLEQADAAMKAFRLVVQNAGPIPAMKSLLAVMTGERRWKNIRLPLLQISEDEVSELIQALGPEIQHLRSCY